MKSMSLTQSAVLHFLRDFRAKEGMFPTNAEIAAHFSWRSPNAAFEHVHSLMRKGLIEIVGKRYRFTPKAWEILGLSMPIERPYWCLALPVVDQRDLARALVGRAA